MGMFDLNYWMGYTTVLALSLMILSVIVGPILYHLGYLCYRYVNDKEYDHNLGYFALIFKDDDDDDWDEDDSAGCALIVATISFFGTFLVGLLLWYWPLTLFCIVIYGILFCLRGLIRLKRDLQNHKEDPKAHKREGGV